MSYLGIHLDEHLSSDFHINQISSKLDRANGINSKLQHYVPLGWLIQVYYAIFYFYLNYECAIWGLATEKSFSDKIIPD